ncbi:hypothetical protein ET445_06465 [Agromyces protaetiae]|uniref:Uncharacterized protein n=1 Tax=Agromyces protaetiae TaxID=2509455 RepID=A0A4P6FAP8_9MICO|nr:hypothetical protein [Agromyces protaetiae]QAY73042.1 hypothetical protein ET445_06465 [Agromyces protaetiae]
MAHDFDLRRPPGVTLVAVLVWLGALFDVLAGLLLLIVPQDPDVVEALGGTALVVTFGVGSLLLGVIAAIVGVGLWVGNPIARIAVTVVEVVGLALSILLVFLGANIWNEAISALIAIAIIWLIWTPDASRFFRGLAPDQPDLSRSPDVPDITDLPDVPETPDARKDV